MTTSETTGSEPLRVGVVGAGWTGRQHLLSYSEIPGIQITALAAQEPGLVTELATRYDIPYVYDRWEDLLAREGLDIVSVCTPNHLHAPIAVAALNGGRHVLCEKPLARTGEEAADMVRAARGADRVLKVCFNHRKRADVAALKRYIDAGALGEVYLAKVSWTRRNGIPGAGSWFCTRELSGGGPLIDLGVHVLDLALYLLGEPKVASVTASAHDRLGSRGKGFRSHVELPAPGLVFDVEDIATAFLRLENGATLLLEAGWAGHASPRGDVYGVTLFGTDGGARLESRDYAVDDTLEIFAEVAGVPAAIRPIVTLPQELRGHRGVVREFVRIVRSGDFQAHSGEEGMIRSQVIDACYRSAREGREVLAGPDAGTADQPHGVACRFASAPPAARSADSRLVRPGALGCTAAGSGIVHTGTQIERKTQP